MAELLAVVSVLCLLVAILEPVLSNAKRAGQKTACLSNLRQIGAAFKLYEADWDDRYPSAIDEFTRQSQEALGDYPPPTSLIPDLVTTLTDYTSRSALVWRCPADNAPFNAALLNQTTTTTYPSCFAFAHTSYNFGSVIRWFGKSTSSVNEANLQLAMDAGTWHYNEPDPGWTLPAVNILFGDGHVRFSAYQDLS